MRMNDCFIEHHGREAARPSELHQSSCQASGGVSKHTASCKEAWCMFINIEVHCAKVIATGSSVRQSPSCMTGRQVGYALQSKAAQVSICVVGLIMRMHKFAADVQCRVRKAL